jgi:hypothetical protein
MTARQPLPPEIATRPFRSAQAREFGVSQSRLRASDLYAGVRGTRWAVQNPDFEERCSLWAQRLPSAIFSHTTAALLLGIPLPMTWAKDPRIQVSVPAPRRAPHAANLIGHAPTLMDEDWMTLPSGLRLTRPHRTWLDLAQYLSLGHLVAAGDAVINRSAPLASVADLHAALRSRKSRRGVRRLREALELLSDAAESPQESRLRVILHTAEMGELRINHELSDRFGEFVARTDIEIVNSGVVVEYMGDYHRTTPEQWRADMSRRSRIEAATGKRVLEVNADDLRDPAELVARIRALAHLVPQSAVS